MKNRFCFVLALTVSAASFTNVAQAANSDICQEELTESFLQKFELVVKTFGVMGVPYNPNLIQGFKFNDKSGKSFSYDFSAGPLPNDDDGYESMGPATIKNITVDDAAGMISADVYVWNIYKKGTKGEKLGLMEMMLVMSGINRTFTGVVKLEQWQGSKTLMIKIREPFDVVENCKQHIKLLPTEEVESMFANIRKIKNGEKGNVPTFLWKAIDTGTSAEKAKE